MNQQEAQREFLESLTETQLTTIKMLISIVAKGWSAMKGTLTDRQKELLKIMGDDKRTSETISDIERMLK